MVSQLQQSPAKHGIGLATPDKLLRDKDTVALAVFRSITVSLNPQGLINPILND
ncbi:FAD-linked oxidase C-terminal domain-containing protein [Paracoccus sp. (in: a-proteobacteria)]|uniref:FAD-linked oxidase C-terminal domain-containing protein n=1 Tax=Paracoccus sp. TaxID=267 RepID=UPI00396C8698